MATITGTPGSDVLFDTPDDDNIEGLHGTDAVSVSGGLDIVEGGADGDRLIVNYAAGTVVSEVTSGDALNGYAGRFSGPVGRVDFGGIEHFTVFAGDGFNRIATGDGHDEVTTGAGFDEIDTAGGNDVIASGGANDRIRAGSGLLTVDAGDGLFDALAADLSDQTGDIALDLRANTFSGPAGISIVNVEIVGLVGLGSFVTGSGDDTIVTGTIGANETIDAAGGDDTIAVAGGIDDITGGAGSDRLVIDYASFGAALAGSPLADPAGGYSGNVSVIIDPVRVAYRGIEHFTIRTGAGNDIVNTGAGDDVVDTGAGDDFVSAGSGVDRLDGGEGEDALAIDMSAAADGITLDLAANAYSGPAGTSLARFEYLASFTSGSGNDTIVTRESARNDTIDTGGGDDVVTVAGGDDRVTGGAGSDRLVVDYGAAAANVSGFTNALGGGAHAGSLGGGAMLSVSFSGIEHFTIETGSGEDTINVGAGNDVVVTGGGNDTIFDSGGVASIDAGAGNDQVVLGGTGVANGGAGEDGLTANFGASVHNIAIDVLRGGFWTGADTALSGFEYLPFLATGAGNDVVLTGFVPRDERIVTGAGDDFIRVAGGHDNVDGRAGDDQLFVNYAGANPIVTSPISGSVFGGHAGSFGDGVGLSVQFSQIERFTIFTGSGHDSITTGGGSDVIGSGDGNDTIDAGAGALFVDGGAGIDSLTADFSAFTSGVAIDLNAGTGLDNIEALGTSGGAIFRATANDDTIATHRTLALSDTIDGGAGNDTISVARGADTIHGGAGSDRLVVDYGAGAFSVRGEVAGDLASGYAGDFHGVHGVVTFTGFEHFTIDGGAAGDFITVGDGNDVVDAGDGSNFITSSGGNDVIDTGAGDDRVFTGNGDDLITTGGGRDFISAGAGLLTVDGGAGLDALAADFSGVHENITLDLRTSAATGVAGIAIANIEFLASVDTGSGADTVVLGINDTNETVRTRGGDDTITVGGGFDDVDGGAGLDRLIADYSGASAAVTFTAFAEIAAYSGTLFTDTGNARFRDIEHFTIATGAGDDQLTTGDGDDAIRSGAGADHIFGAGGADTLDGGDGDDRVVGGSGDDLVIYEAGGGADTVFGGEGGEIAGDVLSVGGSAASDAFSINALSSFQLGVNIDSGAIAATPNAEIVAQDIEKIRISGGAGVDRLGYEHGGASALRFSVLGDLSTGYAGAYSIADVEVAFDGVEQLTITGGAGDDEIATGDGADVLAGGAGNDVVEAGGGDDLVVYNAGEGIDKSYGGSGGETLGDRQVVNGSVDGEWFSVVGSGTAVHVGIGERDEGASADDAQVLSEGFETIEINTGDGGDAVTILGDWATRPGDPTLTVTGGVRDDEFDARGAAVFDKLGAVFALEGMGGSDRLTGSTGRDRLDGGEGDDRLAGGQGDDSYVVDAARDDVFEERDEGTDVVVSTVDHTLAPNVENLVLTGADRIDGTGNELDNLIIGNLAPNTLSGEAGDDTLNGAGGGDTLYGGAGNDNYYVKDPVDEIRESDGGGIDTVYSNVARLIDPFVENLVLTLATAQFGGGNAMNNVITGNRLDDTLEGGRGNDRLKGGLGNDTLVGGEDDDTLIGGAGSDDMRGGSGDDLYDIDHVEDAVTEIEGEGVDLVNSTLPSYTLGAFVEKLTLLGAAANGSGNVLANVITGNASANTLGGGDGNDTINGAGGADTLNGDAGNDTLNGGDGTDTLNGGDDNDVLNGGNANDTLNGDAGNDVLNGGGGIDAMSGGPGNDTYHVDNTADTIGESGAGWDAVFSSATYALSADIENLTLTGTAAIHGSGNDGANVITGNAANNQLAGGAGNDELRGGAGADTLSGGADNDAYYLQGNDTVVEDAGGGTDTVFAAVAYTLGDHVENLVLTGAAARFGTGNGGSNVVTGNTLDDVLNGLGGNDVLKGGLGNDTLDGGADADTLRAGGGDDVLIYDAADVLVTGEAGEDTLRVLGGDATLDLTAIPEERLRDIEIIDFTGGSGSNLVLNLSEVLAISSTDTLRIDGDTGDEVTLADAGWTHADAPSGTGGYHTYVNASATLLVHEDVTTHLQ